MKKTSIRHSIENMLIVFEMILIFDVEHDEGNFKKMTRKFTALNRIRLRNERYYLKLFDMAGDEKDKFGKPVNAV